MSVDGLKRQIVLLGPPGAGKGTQAKDLVSALSYAHISTGDLLREAVKKGTPIGREAKAYMDKGELVPDEVMGRLVLEQLHQPQSQKGFVLDGFPRTLRQANILEEGLSKMGKSIELAIELTAPKQLIISRLSKRRSCRDCGANYHLVNIPPKKDGICDACGGALYQRDDDREETIQRRLEVYAQQSKDLLRFYRERRVLETVDGSLARQETLDRLVRLVRCG